MDFCQKYCVAIDWTAPALTHECRRQLPVASRVPVTSAFVLGPAGGDTALLVFVSYFKVQSPSAIPPKDTAAASWLHAAAAAVLNRRFLKVLLGYFRL